MGRLRWTWGRGERGTVNGEQGAGNRAEDLIQIRKHLHDEPQAGLLLSGFDDLDCNDVSRRRLPEYKHNPEDHSRYPRERTRAQGRHSDERDCAL